MPESSGWPLKPGGIRFFVPLFACQQLARHPLTRHLFVEGLGYYPQAAGHVMERQQHDDCLIIYCVKGRGQLQITNPAPLDFSVKEGDLILLPKGVSHRYRASRHDPWTMYWAHFSGTSAMAYLEHLMPTSSSYVVPLGIHPRLVADFENLLSVQRTGYQFSRFLYASNLLAQLLTYAAVLVPKMGPQSGSYVDLDKIHALMEQHLSRHLDLETLARSANLSKYHFSKKYKELTGQSPIQHFLHMKMERACYLLDISGESITAVSESLGYDDPQYFSRLFKKVIGISPRDYRHLDRG
ncbi:MAG: AraC family transcriptional regulator [Ketobacteraceae bacterium]|nr:AraC family transcriptional regulator [Ketobacteraceae bacterium]